MCDICNRSPCHPRCPNYVSPKSSYYCSICGDPILNEEEYVINEDRDYRHYECFCGMRDLLEWLGYDVKRMNE